MPLTDIDGQRLGDSVADKLGNRNLIINGDMRIAQRGTSAFTGTDKFPADRWVVGGSTSVVLTSQNESTEVPDGFQNSAKLSITTADSSIAAGDAWELTQHIEGYNVADLLFGTSSAKSVTLRFSVNCTSTGTFCVVLLGSSDGSTLDRSYVAEYTINSADTWEEKTITVPGDTGGTWHTGNGRGLSVRFGLTAGTTYQKAAGSWGAGNMIGSSNQTQLLSTANSEWYVTGVQLEVGNTATPFEHRSFADELARCQRYYYRLDRVQDSDAIGSGYASSTATLQSMINFPVTMRTNPTSLEQTGTAGNYSIGHEGTGTACTTVPTFLNATNTAARFYVSSTGALTEGNGGQARFNAAGAYIAFPAEL